MKSYQDRLEAEVMTGHPALPCPHCGYDSWDITLSGRRFKSDRTCLTVAVCEHCHIMETPHHVDGNWMGQHSYSRSPASLYAFVTDHAEYLKETT